MSTPAPKRRKLASAALSKPFKSPMVRQSSTGSGQPSPAPFHATSPAQPSGQLSATTSPLTAPRAVPYTSTEGAKATSHPKSLSGPMSPSKCDSVAQLQAELTARQRELVVAKAELDTAQQAARLLRSERDAELEALAHKWRDAARAAAEEVFATAKDRVNGMGGLQAWRGRERDRRSHWDWNDGSEQDRDERGRREGDADEDGSESGGREEKEEEVEGRERREQVVVDGADEKFTMDMMLASLNIDLDVIGYDRDKQSWVD